MIELLIVIAIITIMTSILFVGQNENKAAYTVDGVSRIVAAQIRTMQGDAINGKVIGGKFANAFQFYAFSGDQTYHVRYMSSAFALIDGQDPSIAASKVIFGNDVDFYFKTPSGVLTPLETPYVAGLYNPAAFTVGGNIEVKIVSASDASVVRYICVSNRGSVIEQKTSCP